MNCKVYILKSYWRVKSHVHNFIKFRRFRSLDLQVKSFQQPDLRLYLEFHEYFSHILLVETNHLVSPLGNIG